MKKKKLFILLWVLLNFTALFGQTAKWETIKERPDQNGGVVDGVSDKKGDIYIATTTSVLRFDGMHWSNLGTISHGSFITAITIDDNNNIYIGGDFKKIGDVPVENLAKWESTTRKWSALAKFQYTVQEDGKTYIYDNFGDGHSGGLVCINNVLHASSVDSHVYKYVNGVWQKLGNETADTGVLIYGYLTKDANGGLYGIGKSNDYSVIAKWNGTTWTKLGNAFNSAPKKLAVSTNGSLYAYGDMTKVGMTTINYIAKWDGKQWVNEGAGLALSSTADYGGCSTMAFDQNNKAYAGGAFSAPAEAIVQKTGTQWSAFETDIPKNPNGNSCDLLIFDNARSYLYAFGNPTSFDGARSNYRYYTKPITPPSVSAENWVSIGKATTVAKHNSDIIADGTVNTMIIDNNNHLYVGGHFLKIGTTNASAVAKWDGAKWSALGNGLRGIGYEELGETKGAYIQDLNFDNAGKLYAAGTFTGVTTDFDEGRNNSNGFSIGRFDGTNWTASCKGCPQINDITFTTTNGLYGSAWGLDLKEKKGIVSDMYANPIKYIPKELAAHYPGMYQHNGVSVVYPDGKYMAVDKDNKLYVTGNIIKAGEFKLNANKTEYTDTGIKDIKYLAVWNSISSNWEALGNGLNAKGTGIVYDKNKHILYVSGDFSEANNITAYGAVSYNVVTKAWSPLGVGYHIKSNLVLAPDGTPYATVFHPSWGANYIAKWTGTTWTAIAKSDSFGSVDNFGTFYRTDDTNTSIFVWKSPTAPATTATTTQTTTTTTSQPAASLAPASGRKFNQSPGFGPTQLETSVSSNLSGGSAITIEYWFKGTQLQSAFRLQNDNGFIVAGWGAVPVHLLSNEGTGKTLKIQTKTGGSVQDNQWHHIAVTWSKGTPNGFVSYVDGEQIEAKNAGSTVLPTFTGGAVLGAFFRTTNMAPGGFRNPANLTERMNGELARLRVWKVARTAQEIKNNMGKDLPANTANMLYQGTGIRDAN